MRRSTRPHGCDGDDESADGIAPAMRYTGGMPAQRRDVWWVYLVQRGDGALYTGIALDVAARFAAHCEGRGAKALRGRGPLQLVWRKRVGTQGLALRAEARVKKLKPDVKRALGKQPRRWRRLLDGCAQAKATPSAEA